ncbi:MAG: hypothetical protein H0W68_10935 [Gemmatimonadaceae bacterium]|nr:hypothetical protein [Gemmatimonadaceae bacterium]
MRVLCVGRHAFLSDHLCRYFGGTGAECQPVVGTKQVLSAASRFEPHVIIGDSELLTPALLDAWAQEPAMRDIPVLAVSLTRPPDEVPSGIASCPTAVIYLAGLDAAAAMRLLSGARRARGVSLPEGVSLAHAAHVAAH